MWDSGAAGDGVEAATGQGRWGRSLTSGVYSPEVLPTTFSQPQAPALWKLAVGSRVPASARARRGAAWRPEKSRSVERAPQLPAEAGRRAAQREPGKDAPGGAGGVGAHGGVAEPAESLAAPGSAHPRARLCSPRTSAEKAGPSGPRAAGEGCSGGAGWANGSPLARRRV